MATMSLKYCPGIGARLLQLAKKSIFLPGTVVKGMSEYFSAKKWQAYPHASHPFDRAK